MLYTPLYHARHRHGGERHRVGARRQAAEGHRRPPRCRAHADSAQRRACCRSAASIRRALAALATGTRVTFETTWKTLNGTAAEALRSRRRHRQRRGPAAPARQPRRHELARAENAQPANLHRHAPSAHDDRRRSPRLHLARRHRRPPARPQRRHDVRRTSMRLCDRLDLTDALNLDGGGSTTMVVKGTDREQAVGRGRAARGQRRHCGEEPLDAGLLRRGVTDRLQSCRMDRLYAQLCCRFFDVATTGATPSTRCSAEIHPSRSQRDAHLVRVLSARTASWRSRRPTIDAAARAQLGLMGRWRLVGTDRRVAPVSLRASLLAAGESGDRRDGRMAGSARADDQRRRRLRRPDARASIASSCSAWPPSA